MIFHWMRRLLSALLVILASPAIAGTVVLEGPFSGIDLSAYVDILEDTSVDLPFEDVHKAEFASNVEPFLYMGFTRSAYWLRFDVENRGAEPVEAVLSISQAFLDRIEFYAPGTAGDYRRRVAGESLMQKDHDGHINPAFYFTLPSGISGPYYLRINTVDTMLIPLSLWERNAYEQSDRLLWLFYGISFGALIAVIFYSLFLYLTTRDPSSGFYVLYVTAFLIVLMDFDGFFTAYLWPGSLWWSDRFHVISSVTMAMLSLMFIQSFLSTRSMLVRIHRIINFYRLFGVFLVAGALYWDDYADVMQVLVISSLFFPMLALTAGVMRFRQGERTARFFLLAWAFGAVSVLIYLSMHLGILPGSSFWVIHAMDVGVVIESILFSLAIADKMDQHRRDKIRIECEAKEQLAEMVDERTAELNEARLQAEQLANTDMLTQLNNRRAFYSIGEVLQHNSGRYQRPLSAIMLDIDHFKAINDKHGHAAGDEAIRAVGETLSNVVREADVIGRLGGEEFAVLLPETLGNDAYDLAERIRSSIAELVVDAHGKAIRFTASLGVAQAEGEVATIDALIAAADRALYYAKENGRNRTVVASEFAANPQSCKGKRLIADGA